ncbi:MAG: flagellar hook-length control protein FliK [Parvularculaceae bacterium]|nr:flagellar hook-length control protein FliK [Parvularculaceae bacterium]
MSESPPASIAHPIKRADPTDAAEQRESVIAIDAALILPALIISANAPIAGAEDRTSASSPCPEGVLRPQALGGESSAQEPPPAIQQPVAAIVQEAPPNSRDPVDPIALKTSLPVLHRSLAPAHTAGRASPQTEHAAAPAAFANATAPAAVVDQSAEQESIPAGSKTPFAARTAPEGPTKAPDVAAGALTPAEIAHAAPAVAEEKSVRSASTPSAPAHPEPVRIPALAIVSSVETRDGRIELRLDPPHLGPVHIDVASDESGVLRAVISTESAETLDIARRHVDVFRTELHRLGFGDLDLQFADREEPGGFPNQNDRHRRDWRTAPEANPAFDLASFVEFDGGRFDVLA